MEHRSRRIALVGPSAPWRGGIAQYVDGLSDALTDAGHETRILTFSRQYPSLLFPGTSQVEAGVSPRPEARRGLDSLNPITWVREGRRLRRWEPDLVLANYWLPFFAPMYEAVFRAQDRAATRLALDCHNVEPHEKRPGDELLIRRLTRLPHSFIVHSNSVAETLTRYRPDAVSSYAPLPLSANFADGPGRVVARRRLGLDAEAPVLLFFGFVRAYKGLDLAIEALAHLPANVRLVVAGEFYESGEALRERAEAVAPGRVRFVESFIPSEEVGVYFDAADVVVLPYHRATQSGVLPLAWRFGVPSVATAVGGLTELITPDETGILVAPGDAAAFAEGVTRALDPERNAAVRRALGAQGGALSWERAADVVVAQCAD